MRCLWGISVVWTQTPHCFNFLSIRYLCRYSKVWGRFVFPISYVFILIFTCFSTFCCTWGKEKIRKFLKSIKQNSQFNATKFSNLCYKILKSILKINQKTIAYFYTNLSFSSANRLNNIKSIPCRLCFWTLV